MFLSLAFTQASVALLLLQTNKQTIQLSSEKRANRAARRVHGRQRSSGGHSRCSAPLRLTAVFEANLGGWKERGARGASAAVSLFNQRASGDFVEIAGNTCKCCLRLLLSPPKPGFDVLLG